MTSLEDLRALSEAATPGPWHDRPNHKPYRIVVFGGKRAYDEGYTTADIDAATAKFIVAAVNYVRAALTRPVSETPEAAPSSETRR